jgi:hypothetical protein
VNVKRYNLISNRSFALPVAVALLGACAEQAGSEMAHNIKLLDLNFLSCARSGYGGQRNANDVTVSRCFFDGDHIGATMADNEATGGEWARGLVFTENTLVRTQPGGDTYGLSLTSQSHFVVSSNVFVGRGMDAYRATDGQISNNVFDATDQLLEPGVIDLAERRRATSRATCSTASSTQAFAWIPGRRRSPAGWWSATRRATAGLACAAMTRGWGPRAA